MMDLRPFSVAMLLCAFSTATSQEKKPLNYYPLKTGHTWHYRVDINGKMAMAASTVAAIEKIDGRDLARLEGTMDGKIIATEHLATTPRGIFRHQYNGIPTDPPFLLLRYPLKPGDKWEGTARLGKGRIEYTAVTKEEMVETPAGKYSAVRVDFDLTEAGNRVATSYWFAPEVGMVKQTIDAAGVTVTLILDRFEKTKK